MTTGTAHPPSTEATIGPWLLQAKIGRGATAIVYRAVNVHTGQQAALKLFGAAGCPCYAREAAAAEMSAHPNLVRVLESGHDVRGDYVVIELVAGADLASRPSAPLSIERALQIAADIAAGLAHMHKRGKVHGDVKPANILIDDMGQAKLTDFGTVDDCGHRADTGSPAYMSPEQALGKCLDARSDLYSLGIVLFEMLQGTPPFSGPEPVAVMAMQVHQALPALDCRIPREVAAIVRRCLEKNPSRRYGSAADLLAALQAIRPARSWKDAVNGFMRRLTRRSYAA